MPRNVLAFLCPDWRAPALVIEVVSCEVIYANWRGLRFLKAESAVRLDSNRLVFHVPEVSRQFFAELNRALSGSEETAAFVFRDDSGGCWCTARIHVARGFMHEILKRQYGAREKRGGIAVIEFVSSLDEPGFPAVAAFARAFRLAPAERQLVSRLMGGLSLAQIAETDRLRLSTIRQRTKSILAKTGCHHQADLVRLALKLCL